MKKLFSIIVLVLLAGCSGLERFTPTAPVLPEPSPTRIQTAVPATVPIPTNTMVPLSDGAFFEKPAGDTFRVLNYNVNWDSIFPLNDPDNHDFRLTGRVDQFARILNAVQPDVVCLQEINPRRDENDIAELINAALGVETWTSIQVRDSVIASHFDVLTDGYALDIILYPPELPQAAALVDLPDAQFGDADLFMVCSHFKSGGSASDISLRQRQADAIMGEVQDAITTGDAINLANGTPMLLLGDYNAYDSDPAAHMTTLLTGDIQDEDRYGEDFAPDWDGTALADLLPTINALGLETYTWREDGSGFNPWTLDHILFTDSVLIPVQAFILDTTRLSLDALLRYALEADDVLLFGMPGNYDHLPMVVDFALINDD